MYNPVKPFKREIVDLIKSTWETPYVSVEEGIYPVVRKKFSYPEVDHTDGIGTKGYYHWCAGTLENAVIDALAMNLNDLALMRAYPYKLQDHITVPEEDDRVLRIMQALAQECKKRNIAITGGENSFHNNSEGLDISVTMTGFVKETRRNEFKIGDALIGLPSSGLHSNGFSKVRELFGSEIREEFTVSTAIYLDTILALSETFEINGMMHITGGAFTKLKDVLGSADAVIHRNHELQPHTIFREIKKRVADEDMYKTFNCGIGFIISTPPGQAKEIAERAQGAVIGGVISGDGRVKIESAFSDRTIEL